MGGQQGRITCGWHHTFHLSFWLQNHPNRKKHVIPNRARKLSLLCTLVESFTIYFKIIVNHSKSSIVLITVHFRSKICSSVI